MYLDTKSVKFKFVKIFLEVIMSYEMPDSYASSDCYKEKFRRYQTIVATLIARGMTVFLCFSYGNSLFSL